MRFECPTCGQRYNATGTPPIIGVPVCTNGGRHSPRQMTERDEYQAALDELGIPLDDPLRFA